MTAFAFDLDGTLADTRDLVRRGWLRVAGHYGIELSEDDLRAHAYGRRTRDVLHGLLHLPPDEIDRLMADGIDDKTAEVAAGPPIPEVPGAVGFVRAAIADGHRTALVSSASRANVDLALRGLGLDTAFDVVIDSGQVPVGKPAPDPYLLAAERLKTRPSELLVFEDSVAGLASARAAGARCVAITTLEPPERLAGADLVIDGWSGWTPARILAALDGP